MINIERIIKEYNRVLPKCEVYVSNFKTGSCLSFYFAQCKEDYPYGYRQNDPLSLTVWIYEEPNNLVTVKFASNSITSKPTNKYMAYGSERITAIGSKKPIATEKAEAKIIKAIENTKRLLVDMLETDKVHQNHIELFRRINSGL